MPEIGSIGRSNSAMFEYNLATDEYLDLLRWPDNIEIYEKMKRSDSQIKAMLLVLELPLRSTKWYVEPADKSSKAKKIAEFVENNLFSCPPDGMKYHFDDFLRQACTMFAFGHSIFEIVYKLDGQELKWSKFAHRPVSTIYDFIYTDNGELEKVQQQLINNSWKIVDIPADKLLIFTHRMENGDVRGQSILRTAYKHWTIKDFLYKTLNIGIERNYIGTPTVTIPANATDQDIIRAKEIVKSLRGHSMGGATIPDNYTLGMFEGSRNMADIMPYIEHQDLMIVRSILAQFINLGSNSVGSFALSENQTDMFLMMLGAEAKYFSNTINSYAIPQLVKYNFSSDLYPKLNFKSFGGQEKLIETLKLMVDGKIVVPDKNLEEWMREMLELPEKSEDEEIYTSGLENSINNNLDNKTENKETNKQEQQIEEENEKEEDKENITSNKKLSEDNIFWARDLTSFEKNINLTDIEKDFESLEDAFRNEGRKIIEKQVKDLSEKAKKTDITKLATIQVKYKAEMQNFVFSHFKKAFDAGSAQVQKELNVNKPEVDLKAIEAQAAITANNISERVKTVYLSEYFNEMALGDLDKAARRAERAVLRC